MLRKHRCYAQGCSSNQLSPLSSFRHLLSHGPVLSAGQNSTTARRFSIQNELRSGLIPTQQAPCAAFQLVAQPKQGQAAVVQAL